MSVVYYVFAFASGAVASHYFMKYGIRWTGKQKNAARSVVRGLSQKALLTFHEAVEAELRYRRAQPSAEDGGEQSEETARSES